MSTKSRAYRLNSFGSNTYIKRDDELSFGVSGSKLRKALSLIPYLKSLGCTHAGIIGSAHSNFVLGMCQLLIENCITPHAFLLKPHGKLEQGNFLLTSLFIPKQQIHFIDRSNWPEVEEIAKGRLDYVLKEGGLMMPALSGSMTLATDILRNEEELGLEFQHIYLESGSGMTAIALILAFSWLKKNAEIHILGISGNAQSFQTHLHYLKSEFEQAYQTSIPYMIPYRFFHPRQARSFGTTNSKVFSTIRDIARKEGILIDPLYGAKLFAAVKEDLSFREGNVLMIHSGGALSLIGFTKHLECSDFSNKADHNHMSIGCLSE